MTDAQDVYPGDRVQAPGEDGAKASAEVGKKPRRLGTAARAAGRVHGRAELWAAVVVGLLGASLAAAGGSMTWLTVRIAILEGVAPVTVVLSGSAVQPGSAVLAVAALAAGAGVLATRRWGRLIPGLALMAVGLWVLVGAVSVLADPHGAAASAQAVRQATGGQSVIVSVGTGAGAMLALAGGLLMAVAGLLVVVRGWRWGALGERYQRPSAVTPHARGDGAAGGGAPSPASTRAHAPAAASGNGTAATGTGAGRAAGVSAASPDAWRAIEDGQDPTQSP